MITKITVGSPKLQTAVFAPVRNGHRPVSSLPLGLVTGYDVLHQNFSLVHDCRNDVLPFTAEAVTVGEFLDTELCERAISFENLAEIFRKSHLLLTLEQAIRFYRVRDEFLPATLVLFPTEDPIRIPGFEEAMFLARGVEFGRKRLCQGNFVRNYRTSMVLLSGRHSFTEDTLIVGIRR